MAVFAEHMILGMKFVVRALIDEVPDGVERLMAHELLSSHEDRRLKVEGALGFQEDIAGKSQSISVLYVQ